MGSDGTEIRRHERARMLYMTRFKRLALQVFQMRFMGQGGMAILQQLLVKMQFMTKLKLLVQHLADGRTAVHQYILQQAQIMLG